MIDYTVAKRTVQDYLIREYPNQQADIFLVDDETISTDYGWVFLCNEHLISNFPITLDGSTCSLDFEFDVFDVTK